MKINPGIAMASQEISQTKLEQKVRTASTQTFEKDFKTNGVIMKFKFLSDIVQTYFLYRQEQRQLKSQG